MPPALPRLPAGTCALTTHGPISPNAAAASCGDRQKRSRAAPGSTAGVEHFRLGDVFHEIHPRPPRIASVFAPVRPEQFLFAWLVLRDRGHEVSDVEKVLVAQVLGDAVLLPRAAAHGEREAEPAVEAAAIAEGVGEVHEDPHDVEILGEFAGSTHVGGVDAAGMALALMLQDLAHSLPWRPRNRGRGRP